MRAVSYGFSNKNISNIMANKRLTRSHDRVLAGVCGGLAEYFELDPTLVRLGYVLLSIFSAGFPGILVYIICLLVIPNA